jgi:GTP-binding protein HflX
MYTIKENEKEKALIISLAKKDTEKKAKFEELTELESLAKTAGAIPIEKIVQIKEKPDTATFIGKGKANYLKDIDVDILLFNESLSPAQISNLEEITEKKVLDRQDIILDIFAQHARTKSAKIEVELAQLNFRLSRLTGHGKELSRLGGGIGTRGPGEKKLEVDRRKIRRRINHLKKELKKVEKTRIVHRKNREGAFSVALLGYTNAGKTTLLNALTNSNAKVEDKLFVTLDPLTRLAKTNNGNKFLLIDTVGFIRGIPTEIMSSFKSTLEEAKDSSLRIILVDSSSEIIEEELEETRKIMDFLEISDSDNILTFNKIDQVIDPALSNNLQKKYPEAVFISAKTKKGFEPLLERINAYKKRFRN